MIIKQTRHVEIKQRGGSINKRLPADLKDVSDRAASEHH